MRKKKIISVPKPVIEHLREDFQNDRVKIYTVEDLPSIFVDKHLIHPEVLEKCSSISVAASGCTSDGRDYFYIAGLRVDEDDGKTVTDIDPIIMAFDQNSESPEPSGVVRFHGDFEGRTEIEIEELDVPIEQLRKEITTTEIPFDKAHKRFTQAMHYMAVEYRKNIDKDS